MSKAKPANKAGDSDEDNEAALNALRDRARKAPPCRAFRSLVVLSQIKTMGRGFSGVHAPEDLEGVKAKHQPFKNAIAELLQMTRTSLRRLKQGITAAIKDQQGMSRFQT